MSTFIHNARVICLNGYLHKVYTFSRI